MCFQGLIVWLRDTQPSQITIQGSCLALRRNETTGTKDRFDNERGTGHGSVDPKNTAQRGTKLRRKIPSADAERAFPNSRSRILRQNKGVPPGLGGRSSIR
jgi:hypothetical protein